MVEKDGYGTISREVLQTDIVMKEIGPETLVDLWLNQF